MRPSTPVPEAAAPPAWTIDQADESVRHLLDATLLLELEQAKQSSEIAAVQKRHERAITQASAEISRLHADLESYYRANCSGPLQLRYGTIGVRKSPAAALEPLNDKWTWEKIAARLKRLYKFRYFHPPKPPAIDKVKVKKELAEEQMAQCGLKLVQTESFYVELNRLREAA